MTRFDYIEAIEDGFRQHGLSLAQTKPRREVRIYGKHLPHADPRMVRIAQGIAFLEESNVAVLHHIFSFPGRSKSSFRVINHLIDGKDGSLLAIIDSVNLLGSRTGAAGAVGAKYLSRKNSSIAGIIGTGRQGRTQLRYLVEIRPIEVAYAYSLAVNETEIFCTEMSTELGIDVMPSENIENVVKNVDILVTATPAMSPIVMEEWIPDGIHINIIGADDAPKIELEGAALKRADKLIIAADDCYKAGQMRIPIENQVINKNDIYSTIGEIVAGIKAGREGDDEITIFHSPGVTLQDAAAVYRVYLNAKKRGIGLEISDQYNFDRTDIIKPKINYQSSRA